MRVSFFDQGCSPATGREQAKEDDSTRNDLNVLAKPHTGHPPIDLRCPPPNVVLARLRVSVRVLQGFDQATLSGLVLNSQRRRVRLQVWCCRK
jgi:hypothetical protein